MPPLSNVKNRQGTRLLASAVAALWLAGQLSGTLHLLSAPHTFCWEHGDFVDAEASSAHLDALVASKAPDVEKSLQTSNPESFGHSHEHCAVSATRRQPGPLKSISAATVGIVSGPETISISIVTPLSSFLLLRLAPKNSPPV
jgi:hypothetical protein